MNKKTFPIGKKVVTLDRGGYLVDTSIGYIQVGSPPETIKDTMFYEKGVPQIFCLPKKFFNRDKGISVAEIEFPLYYNFFLQKRKTIIVCIEEYKNLFSKVMREALFGPEEFNLENDYAKDHFHAIPNLKAELKHFVTFKFEDIVDFRLFDTRRELDINGCKIRILENDDYEIIDPQYPDNPIHVSGEVHYKVTHDLGAVSKQQAFVPPRFGVTCLGPSHGFDPTDNTSGFILWINGTGTMVDPPVNSTEWLEASGVNHKLIDSIILTHTHADHDAGTFQKILQEEKITIYTTNTVMESWLRKYSTLTGIHSKELTQLFNFHPVMIGSKINIHGGLFEFFYSLHSVPTVGFRFHYQDKSFVYSSDHLNYPPAFKELLEKNIFSKQRYEELMNFPWDADIIYHESGFPPLHTPVQHLNSLPEEIQKKITVYHIARKDFPDPSQTHLTLATFGIANTQVVPVKQSQFADAYGILDIFSKIDLFKDFSLEQTKELISVVRKETIPQGTRIITKGKHGDKFYIIISGSIRVSSGEETKPLRSQPTSNRKDNHKDEKRFGSYQYFGEVSLLLNKPRTANIDAETDIEAFSISKAAFLTLIRGTSIETKLRKIALNRDEDSWNALRATSVFDKLTASQKTSLELLLERIEIEKELLLIKKGEIHKDLYIFHSGDLIQTNGQKSTSLKMGDFLGSYREFNLKIPSTMNCLIKSKALLFKLPGESFRQFISEHPGVYLRFFEALG